VSDLDWPAARKAIDTAIERARREIATAVRIALGDLSPADAKHIGGAILQHVQDSLDDVDQTIPPEEDDDD
jgi:hypothetical protein